MKNFFSVVCLTSTFISLNASAIETIVVTADRIRSDFEKSPSDIRVFSNEEIAKAPTLVDLLKSESDIRLAQSGGPGSSTSVFLRGSDSGHTLVVMDGIIMNDPSNPNRQFDLGKLSLNNIDKIEILKGSQGLLYGSNAVGGVIVITSKKASQDGKISGSSSLEYGSFNSIGAAVNLQKKIDQTSLSFGVDHFMTDGFSAANKNVNPSADDDGQKRTSVTAGFTQHLTSKDDVTLNYHYMYDKSDLDKGSGAGQDDPNDYQFTEEQYLKAGYNRAWDFGETEFSYTRSSHHRTLNVLPDKFSAGKPATFYRGLINTFGLNHTQYTTESLTQYLDVDYVHEEDQSKHKNSNLSAFLYNRFELGKNVFNAGIRSDHNRIFSDHLTYKFAYLRELGAHLFKMSYSTGFVAPSINQLYTPTYGNKDLTPEKSQTAEVGVDIALGADHKYTSSVFYTDIKNRLSYDPVTYVNQNRDKARIVGFENRLDFKFIQALHTYLSGTWLSARDTTASTKLIRRPSLNIRAGADYQYEKHQFDIAFEYVGKRKDYDFPGNTVDISSHYVTDIGYQYAVNAAWTSYLKVKNVFDKDYEEVFGYGTGGRAATLGLRYLF